DFFGVEDAFLAEGGHRAAAVDHLVFDRRQVRFEFVQVGPDFTARPRRLERVAGTAGAGEDFLAFGGERVFAAPFFAARFFFGFGTAGRFRFFGRGRFRGGRRPA